MEVLIDTNIVLDWFLKRKPFYETKDDILTFINKELWTDLEDGLQMCCASKEKLDYIITRNIDDFVDSPISAILPDTFLTL